MTVKISDLLVYSMEGDSIYAVEIGGATDMKQLSTGRMLSHTPHGKLDGWFVFHAVRPNSHRLDCKKTIRIQNFQV